jgi:hypothetical protein
MIHLAVQRYEPQDTHPWSDHVTDEEYLHATRVLDQLKA